MNKIFETKYPGPEKILAENMEDKKLKRELAKIIYLDLKLPDKHELAVRFNKAKDEKDRDELENIHKEVMEKLNKEKGSEINVWV